VENDWAERVATVNLRVNVEGCEYLLRLERNGTDCAYNVTGSVNAEGSCAIEEVSPGVFSVLTGNSSLVVRLVENSEGVEAWIGARRFVLGLSDPRDTPSLDKGAAVHGPKEIRALMPGKVIKLLVSVGDHVAAGDGLIVVEAMKMQNEMKSPKNGKVRGIHVAEGETVSAGTALLTID